MQTRIIDRAHPSVNPSTLSSVVHRTMRIALAAVRKTKPPASAGGNHNGRYKTRTCDLHDVNVAL
jgi:hypothetical protein